MPKFSETLTDEQRRAAIGYAIAHRSAPAAIRAAEAGQLGEPFTISKSYLCELVRDEKERRADGAAPREATAAELADAILKRELRRLDGQSRGNRLNAEKAKGLLPVLRQLEAIARRAPASSGGDDQGADDGAPAEPETPIGILERLAAEEAATNGAGQSDDGGDGDGHGDTDGRAQSVATIERHEAERATSAVRARSENLRAAASGV